MKKYNGFIDIEKVFRVKNERMHRGAWWYWFWLFLFDNPSNPDRPRQLMIIWSSKNEKNIECNGVNFGMKNPKKGNTLNGVVASWYYDGNKMYHNFLLEQCDIFFEGNSLHTNSTVPTCFCSEGNSSRVKIGSDFDFKIQQIANNELSKATLEEVIYLDGKKYNLIEANHLKLTGKVKGKSIQGSAYFIRVLYSLPYPSWYWGIFHFENGSSLTYFDYTFGGSLKRDTLFFDGKRVHSFNKTSIKMIRRKNPVFKVSAKNSKESIEFTVSSYSHTAWTIKKKYLGIIPNRLVYNEYPATISNFKLTDNLSRKTVVLKQLGRSSGNAEFGDGLLL
jgi:hypothetical protein